VEQRKKKANYDCLATVNTFERGSLVFVTLPSCSLWEKPKVPSALAGPFQDIPHPTLVWNGHFPCDVLHMQMFTH